MTSGADAAVLLQGLAMFVGESLRPAVADKALAFRARVAQHLLISLALELRAGEVADRAAIARLEALLAEPSPRPETAVEAALRRRALEEALAERLRARAPLDRDAVDAHLRAALADELAVTNPRFDLAEDLP